VSVFGLVLREICWLNLGAEVEENELGNGRKGEEKQAWNWGRKRIYRSRKGSEKMKKRKEHEEIGERVGRDAEMEKHVGMEGNWGEKGVQRITGVPFSGRIRSTLFPSSFTRH